MIATRTVNTDTLSISYLEYDAADGWPVTLSHGFPYDVHAFDFVAARGPYIVELIDALEIERPILGGFDWGGTLLAWRQPSGGTGWRPRSMPTTTSLTLVGNRTRPPPHWKRISRTNICSKQSVAANACRNTTGISAGYYGASGLPVGGSTMLR
jgi:hypothetical protein